MSSTSAAPPAGGLLAASRRPPPKNHTGRPSTLTPAVVDRLAAELERSQTRRAAAAAAGVSERSLYRWLSEARADDAPPLHRELLAAVRRAEGLAEHALVEQLRELAELDANVACWLLSRRYSTWARPVTVAVGLQDAAPAQPDARTLRELIRQRVAALTSSRAAVRPPAPPAAP